MSQRGIAAGFTRCSFISIPTLITNEPPCLILFYGALLFFPAAIRKLLMWKKERGKVSWEESWQTELTLKNPYSKLKRRLFLCVCETPKP